jgi:hypothetical protein
MNIENPTKMASSAILDEILALREGLERTTTRLHELSRTLYAQSKGADGDEVPALLLYANAWARFSAAISQGLQRTANVERVLKTAQRRTKDIREKEASDKARQEKRDRKAYLKSLSTVTQPSGIDDLVALYGPDVVHDHA